MNSWLWSRCPGMSWESNLLWIYKMKTVLPPYPYIPPYILVINTVRHRLSTFIKHLTQLGHVLCSIQEPSSKTCQKKGVWCDNIATGLIKRSSMTAEILVQEQNNVIKREISGWVKWEISDGVSIMRRSRQTRRSRNAGLCINHCLVSLRFHKGSFHQSAVLINSLIYNCLQTDFLD